MTDAVEKVEKPDVEIESDDEAPGLVEGAPQADAEGESRQETRMEKKSRKAMAKMGLKPFPGVTKVVMKRNKTTSFTIQTPDVFVSKNTYVVFGEAKMDSLGMKEQELLKAFEAAKAGMDAKAPAVAEEDEEEVDAEGVAEKDIEVVLNQVTSSRAKVIKALKKNNNDVVQTIMDLNE